MTAYENAVVSETPKRLSTATSAASNGPKNPGVDGTAMPNAMALCSSTAPPKLTWMSNAENITKKDAALTSQIARDQKITPASRAGERSPHEAIGNTVPDRHEPRQRFSLGEQAAENPLHQLRPRNEHGANRDGDQGTGTGDGRDSRQRDAGDHSSTTGRFESRSPTASSSTSVSASNTRSTTSDVMAPVNRT